MRVEVIRPHCLGGGVDAYAGDIVEIDENVFGWKLQQGWVKPAPAPVPETPAAAEPQPEPEPEPVSAAAAEPQPEPEGDETAEGDEQHGVPAERPGRRRRS